MVSTHPDAFLGGPRSHVLGVIQGFQASGWKVRKYIVGDQLSGRWRGQDNAAQTRSSAPRLLFSDLLRLVLGPINARRVDREMAGVDWAYERFASFQVLGRSLHRKGIPWVLETNALMYIEAARDRRSIYLTSVARNIETRAYRDCDVLLCVTEVLRDAILQILPLDPKKVLIVPNAVDLQLFDPAQARPVRYFDGLTIGYVGSLVSWQGLHVLLRALAALRDEGIEYNLVIVGDGPQRREWEQLAGSLGLMDRVRFMGKVSRPAVPGCIAGFDLGYSGQVALGAEGMYLSPLKLYEYMAMAKPVVAAAFEDARRLLGGAKTGYLFAAGDVDDLKVALRRAHAEHLLWDDMGRAARLEIRRQHSWEARVAGLIPQVEEILLEKYGTPFPTRRSVAR
jgi:glycosyltransferase involved in cell wall biosynthesis